MEAMRRNVIAEMSRAGNSPLAIIEATGYPKATVYRTVTKQKTTGDVQRCHHKPRNDRKRTSIFLTKLKRSIKANCTTPMSKLAKKFQVSRRTIARGVKGDLGMKSYVRRRRNILTARSMAIRAERSPNLLSHLKHKGGNVRVFVDEKKFVVDEVTNRQNSRVIAYDPSEVPPVLQSKNPASAMVFGAVASDGRLMPPHFIAAGLKINTAEYMKILEGVMMPWIKRYYEPSKVMFVQDSAPAHGSKMVQQYLREQLPLFVSKDIWPSSSPDLNPCDFWMWGVVEAKSNATPHNSVKALQAAIVKAFKSITVDEAKNACSAFRGRIEKIIAADGGHIE
jgi:transposase